MKDKFLAFWNSLSPKKRKAMTLIVVGTFAMTVVVFGWMRSKAKTVKIGPKEPEQQAIKLDSGTLARSQVADYELKLAQQQRLLEALRKGEPVDEEQLKSLDPRSAKNLYSPAELKRQTAEFDANEAKNAADSANNNAIAKNNLSESGLTQPGQQNGKTGTTNIPGKGNGLPPNGKIPANVLNAKSGGKVAGGAMNQKGLSGNLPPLPPPPTPQAGPGQQLAAPLPPPDQELGDISMVSASLPTEAKPKTESSTAKETKKKELMTIYLPPSFMRATLLSGLDAPTAGAAKGNPVPVLIRIKTPAVLPNEVKAELTGCFVIADGAGNLSTERAELSLVNISCLDRGGKAVIDQKIKGFVVDEDGKIGLRGRVVAKFGSLVARSMLAGFLTGAGDALKASSTTNSVSALGITQTIDPGAIGKAAIGNGLSEGFKEINKFYMELAKSTLPIIEVGATKRITLVVSEGINLQVKRLKGYGGAYAD